MFENISSRIRIRKKICTKLIGTMQYVSNVLITSIILVQAQLAFDGKPHQKNNITNYNKQFDH